MALSLLLIAPVAIAQEEPSASPELSAPEGTSGPTGQVPEAPPTAPQTESFPDAPPASDAAPDNQAPGTGTPPTSPAEEAPSPLPSGPAEADGAAPGNAVEPTVPADLPPEPLRDETLPHDLTPLGMFVMADWVVKAVMIGLVIASLVTWIIAIAKGMEILFAKGRAKAGVRRLERATSLNEAINGRRRWRGPVAALAAAAADEAQRSASLSSEGIKERTAIALSRIEARAGRRMSRGTGILATVGSVSPFVGLFGTVWGIMNSFIAISESNTTNLAVVAPGIAEALLATGIGLVAAIPAVVIYNAFSRSISGYRALLSDGSALVMRHLSRDLDRGPQEPRGYAAAE